MLPVIDAASLIALQPTSRHATPTAKAPTSFRVVTASPKGTYVLNLYSNDGRLVYTQQLQHDGSQATRTITLNSDIAKGAYQLQLMGDNGFKTSKILIKN